MDQFIGGGSLGWITVGLVWKPTYNPIKNALFTLVVSIGILVLIGSLAAFATHGISIGFERIVRAFLFDISGGRAFLFETGFETAVLWLLTILVRVILLFVCMFGSNHVGNKRKFNYAAKKPTKNWSDT